MRSIDQFWAAFFGLREIDLSKPGIKVVPHAALHGYAGAWLFRREQSIIASVPPHTVQSTLTELQGRCDQTITDEEFISLFDGNIEQVIGPAFHGFLSPDEFRPAKIAARLLSAADNNALQKLQAACDAEEWEHSCIEIGREPIFGCFANNQLVAASNYVMWGADVAMPGVITHPAFRKQGYGTTVLGAATAHGRARGFLMLYQTLLTNHAAIAAAQQLGYRRYATHLAVRLSESFFPVLPSS